MGLTRSAAQAKRRDSVGKDARGYLGATFHADHSACALSVMLLMPALRHGPFLRVITEAELRVASLDPTSAENFKCLLQPVGHFLRQRTPMRRARIRCPCKTLLPHQRIARGHGGMGTRPHHTLMRRQIEIPKFRCERRRHRPDPNASTSPLGSRIKQPALPNADR